ncbi:MAG: transposase [Candidatus Altiarchaeota archaeon]
MDAREMRGIQIAEKGGLEQTKHGWIVPAQGGSGAYFVQRKEGRYVCDCPDCQTRGVTCKHSYAVMHTISKTVEKNGTTTVTETKKVTYKQDWTAYNKAQTQEITFFDKLLRDLVDNVDEPQRDPNLVGRKPISLRDDLFCSIQKVYSGLSSRRAHTLYRNAQEREQVSKTPNFNAINKFLPREDITPILHKLLTVSALPLKSVETTFGPDSTGFRSTQFNQYCVEKHNTRRQHHWVKAHVLVGTKTNVIASAKITPENGADCPQFAPLITEAYEGGFEIKEITADKAYTSRDNYNLANKIGATAYLPFKKNDTGKSRGSLTWTRMYHYFQLNREEFLQHYHQRSNVESTMNMVKAKFGDKLKSKKYKAQVNELLCKFICHNICVLIQEMHELGVNPTFTAY